jgi:hypothetical protein
MVVLSTNIEANCNLVTMCVSHNKIKDLPLHIPIEQIIFFLAYSEEDEFPKPLLKGKSLPCVVFG